MNRRPMPEDFREHKRETIVQLMVRYHAGQDAVMRWREECGIMPRKYKDKPVAQIAMDGKIVATYDSVYYAAQDYYGNPSNIALAARNYPNRTAYGYRWRYIG